MHPDDRKEYREVCCGHHLAGLCVRTTDHAELGGSNGHDRSAKKAAAIICDFFEHLSLSFGDSQPDKRGQATSVTGPA
jgi:hypothetical protein